MPYKTRVHRPKGARSAAERKAEYDLRRPSVKSRGYDSKWRKIRAVVVAEEPLCRHCLLIGRTKATQEVDHIIPHKGDHELFVRRDNLQGLCKQCNSRKTATEDSAFARTRSSASLPP